jgi:hypothetical protein
MLCGRAGATPARTLRFVPWHSAWLCWHNGRPPPPPPRPVSPYSCAQPKTSRTRSCLDVPGLNLLLRSPMPTPACATPQLPEMLGSRGIVFIGPSAAPMHALGDKIGATIIAQVRLVGLWLGCVRHQSTQWLPSVYDWGGGGLGPERERACGIPDGIAACSGRPSIAQLACTAFRLTCPPGASGVS